MNYKFNVHKHIHTVQLNFPFPKYLPVGTVNVYNYDEDTSGEVERGKAEVRGVGETEGMCVGGKKSQRKGDKIY